MFNKIKLENNMKGFTLIELVLVIAIGYLGRGCFAYIIWTTLTSARSNAAAMTIASVQEGLGIYMGDQVAQGKPKAYPTALDTATAGSAASPTNILFQAVMEQGVTQVGTRFRTLLHL